MTLLAARLINTPCDMTVKEFPISLGNMRCLCAQLSHFTTTNRPRVSPNR